MLQITVKAINDSARPNGIILTLLVFGAYLQLTKINPSSPLVIKRAKAIYIATKKVCCFYTKRQIKNTFIIHNSLNTKNTLNLPF
jgi:hypothetical protein